MGNAAAPVTLVEFSDFQCPACALLHESLDSARRSFPTSLRVIYRHFPIESIHRHARAAAEASECAAEQGQFEAFHDLMFDHQTALGVASWEQLAAQARVPDTLRFRECRTAWSTREDVEGDIADAASIGVEATPTFVVNGRVYEGTRSPQQLRAIIERALGRLAEERLAAPSTR